MALFFIEDLTFIKKYDIILKKDIIKELISESCRPKGRNSLNKITLTTT